MPASTPRRVQIIAGAGAFGAVTIATNMAGRGVDIKLGGEIWPKKSLHRRRASRRACARPASCTIPMT